MTFKNSILAGTSLVREAVQSPNYTAGSTGWTINQDGSAEFNNITIRGGSSVGGVSLWYNGTPANGNLIFSISSAPGTDPFGNHYAAGAVSYTQSFTTDVRLSNGNAEFGRAQSDFANSAAVFSGLTAGGDLSINSGTGDANHLDQVRAGFRAGKSSQAPGGANTPYFQLLDGDLTSAVDIRLPGAVIPLVQGTGNLETWHSAAYRSGWAAGSICSGLGGDGLHYRRTAEDEVWLLGLAACTTGGTIVMDLPTGYHPIPGAVMATPHGIIHRDSSGVMSTVEMAVDNTGQVILGTAPAAGDVFSFNVRIPIGNLK
ncbi:hypothetical protein AB0D63_43275 [Kitasatospora sp. NPDC048343]|uniref:hypothetical protein n=1 Tax=Kitasatospora sp. NPDC048343 TaxID=3154717 RepID=UPI0033E26EFA